MVNPGHNSAVEPLSEAWWEQEPKTFVPPSDVPILAPYETTRPGFEILVAAACEPELCGGHFEDLGNGTFQVCLWNIWHDVKNKWQSKTDPAAADPEKQQINQMQRALGRLGDDDRYIRLQIACLVRCFWTFPANVDIVLQGISSGIPNIDSRISCEPPWSNSILPALRRRQGHPAAGKNITDSRRDLVRAVVHILSSWLARGDIDHLKREVPEHAKLADTVYRRLGLPNKLKSLQVERLRIGLGYWAFPLMHRPKAWADLHSMQDSLATLIREELGEDEDTIAKLLESLHNGLCHHAFFRHVDHLVAHIGAGQRVRLPGAGEEGRRIRETLTNYVHSLGSWLMGRTVSETVEIWPASEETARRVFGVLGTPTPRKRWLAACLWKRLQDVQSGAGRGPLDEEPQRFAIPLSALAFDGSANPAVANSTLPQSVERSH